MSDYLTKAKRPGSDEWEPVEMRDNYYGPHNYGVQFPDGHVYPDGDCEIIGEKPGETWEERFEKTFGKASTAPCLGCWHHHMNETEHSCACHGKVDYHYVLHPGEVKVFIASEIQSAVEAERRRISEEVGKMYDRCTDWDALKEILSIIDTKK